ncbi:centrosomal protein of 63 kDa isoform X2 [Spea bombifrons]|uniref:centrosomal protein of 63 kDa isoform X2 n=1 Tax=Spea bombifrons TaxID=233779 RepID=UPI0023494B4F|nr:centrosomal protein of 63 kDa isoform X2 [Spea bombifrons]
MEALLERIQQQGKKGILYGSCEQELQELMRQIDIMLDHKRSEWEAKMQILNTRLELREQELNCTQAREGLLNQEVRSLKQQLQETEEENRSKIVEYEDQLSRFQEELSRLKKSYEKVQRRHLRAEMRSKGEEERSEVTRLTRRLEEFRQRSLDWEKQCLLYQQQVAELEAQRRTLAEQADLYQQQSQSHKRMLEQTSLAGRSEFQHLSGRLLRANDSLCAREEEMETLKLQLEVSIGERERAEQELQQAQQDMQGTKAQELRREVCRVNEALRDRESSIRSLEEKLKESRLSDERADVDAMRSRLSISLLNEQKLQAEVTRLEGRVGSATMQCQQLTKELKEKGESLQLLQEEHKKCSSDIKKLRSQLHQAELSYSSALDGMKKEISQLTQELHQKDIIIASSKSEAIDWERKVSLERTRADREAAEHKVSLAALETLQKENRQLSDIIEKQEPDVIQALDNLERENQKLQKELSQTQGRLELLNKARQSEIQAAVERESHELQKRHEEEVKLMKEQLREMAQRYEEELQALRSHLDAYSNERGFSRTSSMESVSSELWKRDAKGSPGPDGNEDSCGESVSGQLSSLPIPPSTPASAIAVRYLQEEELRSQDLLQRLDSHIEELKQDSQRTVQHFTQPR